MLFGFFAFGFLGIFLAGYLGKNTNEVAPEETPVAHHSEQVMKAFMTREKSERKQLSAAVSQFVEVVLPLEFSYRPWYSKFWIRMLEEHPYIAYLAPSEGRENYSAKKWMCLTFELLNVIFIDSIFAPIAAPDADSCGKFTTASACAKPSSIDLIDPLCEWDDDYKICVFRELEQNMGVIIMTVLIIKLVEFPLMSLCEYLVDQVGNNNLLKTEIDEKSHDRKPSISKDTRGFVSAVVEPVEIRFGARKR